VADVSPDRKYSIILAYEQSFAGRVAASLITQRPLSVWHLLMPFVFIFDLVKFKGEIESFTRSFVSLKKLALDAALDINKGENRESRLIRAETDTRDRLLSQKLYSWKTHQEQMAEVNLLLDHYGKLLLACGDSYESLVRNAYGTRDSYGFFVRRLALVEKEVDRAVAVTLGDTEEVWERLLTKQQAMDRTRDREGGRLFS